MLRSIKESGTSQRKRATTDAADSDALPMKLAQQVTKVWRVSALSDHSAHSYDYIWPPIRQVVEVLRDVDFQTTL
jgi:hypothetical protein